MGIIIAGTIICDIDGVIFRHKGDITKQHLGPAEVLTGVKEKLKQWDLEGCTIILITGRRESTRVATEKQLLESGIIYDHLIMGIPRGMRILINDKKQDGTETAAAINLERNEGFSNG